MVRADSDSANASRLATASLPSAAALTRIEKSSEATTRVAQVYSEGMIPAESILSLILRPAQCA